MTEKTRHGAEPKRTLAALQDELASEVRPVRPFHPARIGALIVAIGFGVGLGLVWPILGLRTDAAVLGPWWLWGPAVAGLALGAALIVLALRQLVPGNLSSPSRLVGAAMTGLVACALIYAAVYTQSGIQIPEGKLWQVAFFCFGMEVCLGLPAFFFFLWLARRGLTANAVLTAWVGGIGVTLVADAVWRMGCKFSEPAHFISSHLPGMAVVVLAGAGLAYLWDRRRLRAYRKGPS